MTTVGLAWATRLHAVLGAPIDRLSFADLERVVAEAVREDDDLDFKQSLYGGGDADKRELAADVASLANRRGGILVLGVEEEDGAADQLLAVSVSDGEEQRMRSIVASLVLPYVELSIRRIDHPNEPDQGFYVLIVPPSAMAPHAVRKDRDLRYPRRDGTTTRWLSESEVADAYRDRFRIAADQGARADRLVRELFQEIDPEDDPWIVVSLVPTQAANEVQNDTERVGAVELWARRFSGNNLLTGFLGNAVPQTRVRARRIALTDHYAGNSLPNQRYAELYTDGAGAAALRLCGEPFGDGEPVGIYNVDVIWSTAQCLSVLAQHATFNAGAFGDALVEMRLIGPRLQERPMQLCFVQYNSLQPVAGARPVGGTLVSRHTVVLDDLIGSPQRMLAATRLLVTDVFHALGAREVMQIRADGSLRLRYFGSRDVRDWAAENAVETTDETIG